jgi:uncharacterized membrane-anchored protein
MGAFLANKRVSCLIGMLFLSICTIFVSASTIYGQNQESPIDKVKWIHGPAQVSLGSIANINLPEGYIFADAENTRVFMEITQNPPTGYELGTVMSNNGDWFAVFEFSETGYIKDDEKSSLDADAILKQIKEGNERGNEERKKRGWAGLDIIGWQQPPHYDSNTNNLEWALRAQSSSEQIINYNTKLLGRKGVMSVTLVCDPLKLAGSIPDYKMILANYEFSSGNRYAEFVKGDKVAAYGLTGLMLGGAAAVAAKTGVFKWLWKVLLAGFIGLAAFFKKIFGKKE